MEIFSFNHAVMLNAWARKMTADFLVKDKDDFICKIDG